MFGKIFTVISALIMGIAGVLIWFIPEVIIIGKLITSGTVLWGVCKLIGMLFDEDINWD
jgi:hypothetical protein